MHTEEIGNGISRAGRDTPRTQIIDPMFGCWRPDYFYWDSQCFYIEGLLSPS